MIAAPADNPVTNPLPLTVALPLLLHTPPPTLSVKVTGAPGHTLDGPDIVPAVTVADIFTVNVADAVPQLTLLAVYEMTSVPAATAVTVPSEATVALVLLALQVPPLTVSSKVTVLPVQIEEVPLMLPASAAAFTVTMCVANANPQAAVIV